jgi:hypothetical protein
MQPINPRASWIGATMISTYVLPLLLAVLAWQTARATPIYKWVDSAGRVTYSSTPPTHARKVEKMNLAPGPSTAEVQQAEQRAKQTEARASELEKQRREQEAREAEEARRREAQRPARTIVIEQPVYVPQPYYYLPRAKPHPPHRPVKPPPPPGAPPPRPLPR